MKYHAQLELKLEASTMTLTSLTYQKVVIYIS